MGSYGNAVMTGFICRLCSEQKKCVIHLYSRKGEQMNLMKKIALLPIKVEKYDHLPKTICESCINKVNMQYNLLMKVKKSIEIRRRHKEHEQNGHCPRTCLLHFIQSPDLTRAVEDPPADGVLQQSQERQDDEDDDDNAVVVDEEEEDCDTIDDDDDDDDDELTELFTDEEEDDDGGGTVRTQNECQHNRIALTPSSSGRSTASFSTVSLWTSASSSSSTS